jgi:hypothetical protein
MAQLDMFSDSEVGREADPVAEAKRIEAERLEAHYQAGLAVQHALTGAGLWGYPDLIKNPAGPWAAWKGAGGSPVEHWLCWPATYVLKRDDDGTLHIKLSVREGQEGNPAVKRAATVLGKMATVTRRKSIGTYRDREWEDRDK